MDPYAEQILNRVENGTFGPARCMMPAVSQGAAPPSAENIYTSDDKNGANPFIVGANNQWQQYVLSKYYFHRQHNQAGSSRVHQERSYHQHHHPHQGLGGVAERGAAGPLRDMDNILGHHHYDLQNASSGNL